MVALSAHAFVVLVLLSTVGSIMLWLAVQSSQVEPQELKRCAACGRLLGRGELCRCSRD